MHASEKKARGLSSQGGETLVITKKVEGEVDYNDGEFAEVRTIGIEGIENGLWLGTMQIHRAKIEYTPDEFGNGIPSGCSFRS